MLPGIPCASPEVVVCSHHKLLPKWHPTRGRLYVSQFLTDRTVVTSARQGAEYPCIVVSVGTSLEDQTVCYSERET